MSLTNSLDSETELQIMNSILKLKNELTIIMISHSDKSLNICDEIIDINDFKKVEEIDVEKIYFIILSKKKKFEKKIEIIYKKILRMVM